MDRIDFEITVFVLMVFAAVTGLLSWLFITILSWSDQAQRERVELIDGKPLRTFQR